MDAKALYGVSDRLKASLGGYSRSGLRLPPVDGVQVCSRLVRQAYASRHRLASAAGLRNRQLMIGAKAIHPSRHGFKGNHAASCD